MVGLAAQQKLLRAAPEFERVFASMRIPWVPHWTSRPEDQQWVVEALRSVVGALRDVVGVVMFLGED